jgi:hypothetical protein
MVNTVIPGISAEIVQPDVSRAFGTAGKIAIVGNFERGDSNVPYFFPNALIAQEAMGSNPSYSGSNVIKYAFKQDLQNNNYGATGCVCVKAGTTVKASAVLNDVTPAIALHITANSGGIWANGATNGLKISVAAGSVSGQKFTLKLNDVIVEEYDNCLSATDMMNKINASSRFIIANGSSAELARTIVTVSDTALTDGTETAAEGITTAMLTTALATIVNEKFDFLIFTDTPDPTYLPSIETYLNNRLALAKPSRGIFPLLSSNSVGTTLTNEATADSLFMKYVYQPIDVDGNTLTQAESVARIASFNAGMPVNESMTNKIISDITGLSTEFNFGPTDTGYALVDGGVMMLKLISRENRTYGIVSDVTGIRDVEDLGQKVITSEGYVVGILCAVVNYFDMTDWLGQTGIATSIESAQGELENRKEDLVTNNIVKDIIINLVENSTNSRAVYADLEIIIPGIVKHIDIRVKLTREV